MSQKIILKHGNVLPSGNTLNNMLLGEVLVQHAGTADTALHTAIKVDDKNVLVSFPNKSYVDANFSDINGKISGIQEAVNTNASACTSNFTKISEIIPFSAYTKNNTIQDHIDSVDAKFGSDITSTNTVTKFVKDIIGGEYNSTNTVAGKISGIEKTISELNNTYATDEQLSGAVSTLEGKIAATTTKVVKGTDAGNNISSITETTGTTGTTFTINLTDVASAQGLTAANEKIEILVGTVEGDNTKSVREIANDELVKQLVPSGATEALDTLKEIADWIQEHPGDAATMNSAISANTVNIGNLQKALNGYTDENAVSTAISGIQKQIDELDNTYATDDDLKANTVVVDDNSDFVSITKSVDNTTGTTYTITTTNIAAANIIGGGFTESNTVASTISAVDERLETVEGDYVNKITYKDEDGVTVNLTGHTIDLSSIVIDGGEYN